MKTIKEYNKQIVMIEKCIHQKNLTELEKMDEKITHWKNKKLEVLLSVKIFNLIITEISSSQNS